MLIHQVWDYYVYVGEYRNRVNTIMLIQQVWDYWVYIWEYRNRVNTIMLILQVWDMVAPSIYTSLVKVFGIKWFDRFFCESWIGFWNGSIFLLEFKAVPICHIVAVCKIHVCKRTELLHACYSVSCVYMWECAQICDCVVYIHDSLHISHAYRWLLCMM